MGTEQVAGLPSTVDDVDDFHAHKDDKLAQWNDTLIGNIDQRSKAVGRTNTELVLNLLKKHGLCSVTGNDVGSNLFQILPSDIVKSLFVSWDKEYYPDRQVVVPPCTFSADTLGVLYILAPTQEIEFGIKKPMGYDETAWFFKGKLAVGDQVQTLYPCEVDKNADYTTHDRAKGQRFVAVQVKALVVTILYDSEVGYGVGVLPTVESVRVDALMVNGLMKCWQASPY
jgi:hypothetical protein